MWLPLAHPILETWSATQACALSGNWTSNPWVGRPALNPLSYTSQGCFPLLNLSFVSLIYRAPNSESHMVEGKQFSSPTQSKSLQSIIWKLMRINIPLVYDSDCTFHVNVNLSFFFGGLWFASSISTYWVPEAVLIFSDKETTFGTMDLISFCRGQTNEWHGNMVKNITSAYFKSLSVEMIWLLCCDVIFYLL